MLLLTCFSNNCNLFKHFFLSFCFPEQFCSFACYIDGMFQSKFSFKDNKVFSYLIYQQGETVNVWSNCNFFCAKMRVISLHAKITF